MDIAEGNLRIRRSRTTLGFALACLATSFLFTSVTVVFTAGAADTSGAARVVQLADGTPAVRA